MPGQTTPWRTYGGDWPGLLLAPACKQPRALAVKRKFSKSELTRFYKYLVGGSIYFWVAYAIFAVWNNPLEYIPFVYDFLKLSIYKYVGDVQIPLNNVG